MPPWEEDRFIDEPRGGPPPRSYDYDRSSRPYDQGYDAGRYEDDRGRYEDDRRRGYDDYPPEPRRPRAPPNDYYEDGRGRPRDSMPADRDRDYYYEDDRRSRQMDNYYEDDRSRDRYGRNYRDGGDRNNRNSDYYDDYESRRARDRDYYNERSNARPGDRYNRDYDNYYDDTPPPPLAPASVSPPVASKPAVAAKRPGVEAVVGRPKDKKEALSGTTIEVSPGVYMRLRGAEETWKAVELDFYIPCECMLCESSIFCIQDADFVLCPACKVVIPLAHEVAEGSNGGVGLGFTYEDLVKWQGQITQQRYQRTPYGESSYRENSYRENSYKDEGDDVRKQLRSRYHH